jgi:hypothetical protein
MATKTKKPNKSKAARDEKAPRGKTLTWRGVKLKLPSADKVSGATLIDFELVKTADGFGPIIGLIGTFIGTEQLGWVKQQVVSENLNVEETIEAMSDLLAGIFEKYGMAPGESEASPGS